MSTLLPITPPMMPPAAAPITPPFSLSLLVAAPMTAPAAAPIAASRFVFFLVTTRGSGAGAVPLLALLPLEVERRRAGAEAVVRRVGAGAAAAGALLARRLFASVAAPFIRSAALMESSRAFGFACAASDRSLFNAGSAGLSLHAAAIASAGARMIVLIIDRIVPPGVVGSRR